MIYLTKQALKLVPFSEFEAGMERRASQQDLERIHGTTVLRTVNIKYWRDELMLILCFTAVPTPRWANLHISPSITGVSVTITFT